MGEGAILNLVDAHPDDSQREIHLTWGSLCATRQIVCTSGGDLKRNGEHDVDLSDES